MREPSCFSSHFVSVELERSRSEEDVDIMQDFCRCYLAGGERRMVSDDDEFLYPRILEHLLPFRSPLPYLRLTMRRPAAREDLCPVCEQAAPPRKSKQHVYEATESDPPSFGGEETPF